MNDQINREIAKFPEVFELRAFPGQKFKINRSASYVSGGSVMLYVYTEGGSAFCKGTPAELRKEVCS